MSDIGYGKPPKSGQFKQGQSGNPKGRPKGSKSLKTVVQKELSGKVQLLQNGKPRKVSKMEALVMRLVKDALEGNPKAQSEILKLASTYLPEDTAAEQAQAPTSAEDQKLIDAFVARMNKQAKGVGDE